MSDLPPPAIDPVQIPGQDQPDPSAPQEAPPLDPTPEMPPLKAPGETPSEAPLSD